MSNGGGDDGAPTDAAPAQRPSTTASRGDGGPPLTKTKLFTQGEEGSWTEIGVGVAFIVYEAPLNGDLDAQDDTITCGADAAAGNTALRITTLQQLPAAAAAAVKAGIPPRLVIEGLDDPDGADAKEILLSTPVSPDDIYQVQKGTILIWTDPELARDMAASFHSPDGCRFITNQIEGYRVAVTRETAELRNGNSLQSGASDTTAYESPWAVVRGNLSALRLAVQNNKQRFALMIRETQTFGEKLTALFRECRAANDAEGQQLVADIVFALLNPPFVQDNVILGQLVDETTVEDTIDTVQYFIGRRDADSGFISAEERRAQFRNPAALPKELCQRVHFISAVQRLKDLLPLQLDESDASNFGLLSIYVIRLRFELVQEVVSPESAMYHELRLGEDPTLDDTLLERMAAVVPLLHELTSSVRNSAIPFDPKDSLLCMAADNGLFGFITSAFGCLIGIDQPSTPPMSPSTSAAADPAAQAAAAGAAAMMQPGRAYLRTSRPFPGDDAAAGPSPAAIRQRTETAERLLGRLADCFAHLLSFAPKTRRDALVQADFAAGARPSLLALIFAAIAVVEDGVAQQSLYDVVHFIAFKPPITPPEIGDRVLDLIAITIDHLWTGETVRAARPSEVPGTSRLPPTREKLTAPPALMLIDVVMQAAAIEGRELPEGLARRAHFGLKALCFTMQQLNAVNAHVLAPCQASVARTLGVPGFVSAVCALARSTTVPQTLRIASVQALTSIVSSRVPQYFEALRPSIADVTSALVAVACAHRHRRHGLLFGSAAALVRALIVACEDPTLSAASTVCHEVAKIAIEAHGEDLARGNKHLHEALRIFAVPPRADAAQSDDGLSSTSMVVGATGRRSQSRPDTSGAAGAGGSSPDTSSENPYLSRRGSTSQHRGGGGHDDFSGIGGNGQSVDDEFHALMADFDADTSSCVVASHTASDHHGGSVSPTSEIAGGEAAGLFDCPSALGFEGPSLLAVGGTGAAHTTPSLSELTTSTVSIPRRDSSGSPSRTDDVSTSDPPELKRTRSERPWE